MFERFTDRAKKVVTLAHAEARSLDHDYIGTEHLLLGLISEGEGVAARALASVGVSLDAVREQVAEITGRGNGAPSGHMPFTPRAKKVLELSLRETRQLGHHYIGPEHILLGLVSEGQGVAADVLARLGTDPDRVRQQVRRQLGRESDEPAAEAQRARVRARIPARGRLSDYAVSEPSLYDMLTSIGERLTAIERRLGIPGVVRQEGGVPEREPSEPVRPGPEEAERLRAEVARLQALLRQHGIDHGDQGDQGDQGDPAAAQ